MTFIFEQKENLFVYLKARGGPFLLEVNLSRICDGSS